MGIQLEAKFEKWKCPPRQECGSRQRKTKKDKDRDKMFTYLGGCVDPETWVEEAVVQQLLQKQVAEEEVQLFNSKMVSIQD